MIATLRICIRCLNREEIAAAHHHKGPRRPNARGDWVTMSRAVHSAFVRAPIEAEPSVAVATHPRPPWHQASSTASQFRRAPGPTTRPYRTVGWPLAACWAWEQTRCPGCAGRSGSAESSRCPGCTDRPCPSSVAASSSTWPWLYPIGLCGAAALPLAVLCRPGSAAPPRCPGCSWPTSPCFWDCARRLPLCSAPAPTRRSNASYDLGTHVSFSFGEVICRQSVRQHLTSHRPPIW